VIRLGGVLAKGDIVLTMDSDRRVLKDGGVFIEGDKIVEVGKASDLSAKYRPELTVGGRKKLVMPGFINAHDHYVVGLLRQLCDDRNLLGVIDDLWNRSLIQNIKPEDVFIGARMVMIEQIHSGITTSFDDTVTWLPTRMSREKVIEGISGVSKEVGGIRTVQTVGGFDLEEGLGSAADLFLSDLRITKRDCVNLIHRYNSNDSTIRIWPAASWPLACSPANFSAMKEVADENKTFAFSHVAEVKSEAQEIKKKTGKTEIEYLDDLKFLDRNVLLAHLVWLEDSDIRLLKKRDVKVSHQPICNQYLADGIAPVPAMSREGVTLGLGIDDAGHMNEDFFALMKSFCILHKGVTQEPSVTTAEKALEMATIDGARVLGMEDSLGSLEAGKKADLIVVDLNRWNYAPHLRPVTAMVYAGMASDVETTIVDGKVLMENRKLTASIDEEEIMNDVERTAYDLVERADLHELATESHLGWKMPYLKP